MDKCVSPVFNYLFNNFVFVLGDVALAKAGIAAGVLSVLAVLGFFTFVSLLVTGYVPYSRYNLFCFFIVFVVCKTNTTYI